MTPIDLDVTRSVRAYMTSCLESGAFDLDRVQRGLRDAAWYSPRDRRAARALCDRMLGVPPLVQWVGKRIMRAALDSTMETTMVLTSNGAGILQHSEDAKEARLAFREKRKGKFRGV